VRLASHRPITRGVLTIVVTAALLAGCSSSSSDGAPASSDAAATSTTTDPTADTSTTSTTSVSKPLAASTTVTAPATVPATPAPTPAPTAPKPPTPTTPPAPRVPALSSVRLSAPLPSCNPGDSFNVTINFSASNAAGVIVWSSYDGTLGQFPAEFGSVEVPYTCINGQILFTLQPVAEGGALGASVDLYV